MTEYPRFPMPVELLGREPRQWSGKEATSYLDWVRHILDERVARLLDYFGDDGSGTAEEQLERLGLMVADVLPSDRFSHEMERRGTAIEKGGRTFVLPAPEGRTLTAEGYALAMDMGLLVAKLVLAAGNHKWTVLRRPKSEFRYNHPVLIRTDVDDPLPFGPMFASVGQAHGVLAGTRGPEVWREMYQSAMVRE
jgi:hypothetical protein